jgi:uncharacterized membrane protein YfcA
MHHAVACSLVAIFPAALLTTLINLKRGRVDLRLAFSIEAGAAFLAIAGAYVTQMVSPEALRITFGVVITSLGVRLFVEERARSQGKIPDHSQYLLNRMPPFLHGQDEEKEYTVSLPGTFAVGGTAGFFAGMLGIGGGFLKTPALVHSFGVPARIAAATSLATVAVTSLIGAYTHFQLGHLDVPLARFVVTGFVLGALAGNLMDRKVEEDFRRKLIALNLLLAGLVMLMAPH